jgi:hypothetical protein
MVDGVDGIKIVIKWLNNTPKAIQSPCTDPAIEPSSYPSSIEPFSTSRDQAYEAVSFSEIAVRKHASTVLLMADREVSLLKINAYVHACSTLNIHKSKYIHICPKKQTNKKK